MLKQLIDVKSNKIFVLQTAGKVTSCPACVWQTDLHTGTQAHTADKWQPAISRFAHTSYLNLWPNSHFSDLSVSLNSVNSAPFRKKSSVNV